MLTFNTDTPSRCGIVLKDRKGIVIEFHEKSKKNYGNCANGAIYAFEEEFIKTLNKFSYEINDFSIDVLPQIIGKIYSWHTSKFFQDIGNESALKKANLLAKSELNGKS